MSGELSDDEMLRRRRRSLMSCIWQEERVSGGHAKVVDWNRDIVMVRVQLTPTRGIFAEHQPTITFIIMVLECFPESCPQVICRSAIYHPNIDPTIKHMKNVVSPYLEERWRSSMGFYGILQILMDLLYEPNLKSTCSPFFEERTLTWEEYERNLLLALNAQHIGYCDFFAKNKIDQEEEWGEGWVQPGDAREYWQKTRNVDHDGRVRGGGRDAEPDTQPEDGDTDDDQKDGCGDQPPEAAPTDEDQLQPESELKPVPAEVPPVCDE